MKILVLGVSGMAGHTIALYFQQRGHNVVGFSMTPFKYCNNIVGNIFEFEKVRKIILGGEFDAIINCVGILNQAAEDNHSKAVYLNSYLPHLIAESIKNIPTKLIHMSTDCVFAGNTGPYFEYSLPDGRSFYDRSKALGEVIDGKNLTFRNSIIGPDMKEQGIGLFNWFMKQEGEINGFNQALWTGVTTLSLAKAMESALHNNISGLYHLVNNEKITKYNLLQLFNESFRENKITILEENNFKLDKTLLNSRADFSFKVPSYEQMIIDMKAWVIKYKNIYSHYHL
jgi:dTDP-4-dehydrorhamnose reductase